MTSMKYKFVFIIALLALALVIGPASAFQSGVLAVNVQQSGDAHVFFTYQLNHAERFIYDTVFTKLSPATQNTLITAGVQSILPGKTVNNIGVSRSMATLTVRDFADVTSEQVKIGRGRNTKTVTEYTYKTDKVNFMDAKNFLAKFPLASTISPDYKPALTMVRLPGTMQTYHDKSFIPAITYTQTNNRH
jgi:hypothetical protein